jgi:hypothetical protein
MGCSTYRPDFFTYIEMTLPLSKVTQMWVRYVQAHVVIVASILKVISAMLRSGNWSLIIYISANI